jgi:hypothetical protein
VEVADGEIHKKISQDSWSTTQDSNHAPIKYKPKESAFEME